MSWLITHIYDQPFTRTEYLVGKVLQLIKNIEDVWLALQPVSQRRRKSLRVVRVLQNGIILINCYFEIRIYDTRTDVLYLCKC